MNPVAVFVEWLTRPHTVLALRVFWDFGFGAFLVWERLGRGLLDPVWLAGYGTILVGLWTLVAEIRSRSAKVNP